MIHFEAVLQYKFVLFKLVTDDIIIEYLCKIKKFYGKKEITIESEVDLLPFVCFRIEKKNHLSQFTCK